MKIPENDPLHHLEISRPGTKGVKGGTAKDSGRTGSSHEDKVNISGKSKEIQVMQQLIASFPENRTERVEEIKSQIASGKFRIQPEKIAENLISETLKDA